MSLAVWCVAHSGSGYHGIRTPGGISECQVAAVAGETFAATVRAAGWQCEVLTGGQSEVNQEANAIRVDAPDAVAIELHMNSPSSATAHPLYGHMVQHHAHMPAEHEAAHRIDAAIRRIISWSQLIAIFEQPPLSDVQARKRADALYPNWAFLRGTNAPAILVEGGFAADHRYAEFIDQESNQRLMGWALACAIIGREIVESEIPRP